jgi:4-hydroxy-L-threonine phosphate dehydrogenase PdxA
MTTTLEFIDNLAITPGMRNSMGQEIIMVKHTAKQVHITTISSVDGKPLTEHKNKLGKTAIQCELT